MGTQTTLLAATTTPTAGASQSVAANTAETVGIFVASGRVPLDSRATVNIVTPGAVQPYKTLTGGDNFVQLVGPITYRVDLDYATTATGIYKDA